MTMLTCPQRATTVHVHGHLYVDIRLLIRRTIYDHLTKRNDSLTNACSRHQLSQRTLACTRGSACVLQRRPLSFPRRRQRTSESERVRTLQTLKRKVGPWGGWIKGAAAADRPLNTKLRREEKDSHSEAQKIQLIRQFTTRTNLKENRQASNSRRNLK